MDSEEKQEPTPTGPSPLLWLLAGILFTIIGLVIGLYYINSMLTSQAAEAEQTAGLPTIIRITAPPTPIPTNTPIIPTPTSIPTLTPSPTPDRLVAPEVITGGFFAQVANTDGIGVNFRSGTGRSNELIAVLEEGTVALVLEGPVEDDGFVWWRIELEDGTQGWLVEQFIIPAGQPLQWR